MSLEPTEEMFDNLMQSLTFEKDTLDGDSDCDSDISRDVADGNETNAIVKEIEEDQFEKIIMDKDNPMEMDVENVNPDDSTIIIVSGSESESSVACPETTLYEDTSRDSAESLGIPLDPKSITNDSTTVETVTIDLNQNEQDNDIESTNLSSERQNDCSTLNKNVDSAFNTFETNINSDDDSTILEVNDPSKCNKSEPRSQLAEKDNLITKQNNINNIGCDLKKSLLSKLFADREQDLDMEEQEGAELNCEFYVCKGCSFKFWILRFYYQHVGRVTTKILYDCKVCKKKIKFTNPCLLKIHFKSHGDSLDDLQISDSVLSIDLPAISEFEKKYLMELKRDTKDIISSDSNFRNKTKCPECNSFVANLVNHLEFNPKNDTYFQCETCPCIFTSICSLKMHKRVHNYQKPYYCPECGLSFVTQNTFIIHLFLECFHFRRCVLSRCNECLRIVKDVQSLKNHFRSTHKTSIFKCTLCFGERLRFTSSSAFLKHMKSTHCYDHISNECAIIQRCDLCHKSNLSSSRENNCSEFPNDKYEEHLDEHINNGIESIYYGFKCGNCGFSSGFRELFLDHMKQGCGVSEESSLKKSHPDLVARIKKRMLDRDISEHIQKKLCALPDKNKIRPDLNNQNKISSRDMDKLKSPNKSLKSEKHASLVQKSVPTSEDCTMIESASTNSVSIKNKKPVKATCLLCNISFYDSKRIMNHILSYHRCGNFQKYIRYDTNTESKQKMTSQTPKSTINDKKNGAKNAGSISYQPKTKSEEMVEKNPLACNICKNVFPSKDEFKKHVITHREEGAYQCLECGECFVARNPLEIHLVSAHSILDTAGYISSNFVHNSFPKPIDKPEVIQPYQCSVCFNTFPDDKALHLHFRSHGMAFLRQNFAKKQAT